MRKMISALVVLFAGIILIGGKTIGSVVDKRNLVNTQEKSIAEAAAKGSVLSELSYEGSDGGETVQEGTLLMKKGIRYQVTYWDDEEQFGEVSVIGTKGIKKVEIPNTLKDKEGRQFQVTAIAGGALQNKKNIVSVHIPKMVQKIGKNVFTGAAKLKKITIAKTNENYKVVDNALYTKSGKTLIAVIDTGVTYLIPWGVTKVREGAFVYCKNLKTVKIPATLKQLGVIGEGSIPAWERLDFSGSRVPDMQTPDQPADVVSQHKKLIVSVPQNTKKAYKKALANSWGNLGELPIKEDANTNKPKVYLTFDDGPSSNTKQILRILKKYKVHATFFVLGKTDAASKALYKQIVEEGHSLGVHSTTHNYRKVYASQKSFANDFKTTRDLVWKVTGIKPTLYRFPGGSNNGFGTKKERSKNIAYIKSQGAVYFDWNACNDDSVGKNYSASQLTRNALRGVNKNRESIILMHDAPAKKNTVKSLAGLIKILKQRGYAMEAMDEYVEQVAFTK